MYIRISMYICMYVCMCIYVCIYIYISKSIYIYIQIYICIYNNYISTEAFQNFSLVCSQEFDRFSFKKTELKK